jgi:hypothetical protein
VEEHWAKISPSYPEELGRCMEDINFVIEKSPLNNSVMSAYKLRAIGRRRVMVELLLSC